MFGSTELAHSLADRDDVDDAPAEVCHRARRDSVNSFIRVHEEGEAVRFVGNLIADPHVGRTVVCVTGAIQEPILATHLAALGRFALQYLNVCRQDHP